MNRDPGFAGLARRPRPGPFISFKFGPCQCVMITAEIRGAISPRHFRKDVCLCRIGSVCVQNVRMSKVAKFNGPSAGWISVAVRTRIYASHLHNKYSSASQGKQRTMDEPTFSRPITDLYFFEELCLAIGPHASSQWLADENRKRGIDHSNLTKAVIMSVAPLTAGGRDMPRVKIQAPSDGSCCCNVNVEGNAVSDERFRETPSNLIDDREPSTAGMKGLLSLFADERSDIAISRFKSQSFIEKKLGLLFTDAAHTVLDF
jgi:hypothetical protein